jgi:hypothetical protein
MPLVGFACGVLMWLVCLYLVAHVGRVWRGEPSKLDEKLAERSSEGARARAMIRLLPLTTVVATSVFTIVLVLMALGDVQTPVGYALVALLVALGFAWFALAPAIVFLNRPRCLVPPRLRGEPGLFEDLSRGR